MPPVPETLKLKDDGKDDGTDEVLKAAASLAKVPKLDQNKRVTCGKGV